MMFEKIPDLNHKDDLTEKIKTIRSAFKGAAPAELQSLREEYVQLVKQHPDYLRREIKASIVGGSKMQDFSPEEVKAVETTAEALAETNISLYTGGYTGIMDFSSKIHSETKESEIGVPGKTFAVTIKDILQDIRTEHGINSPTSASERLKILTKQADIVLAMKGTEGSMREVMETMFEDWPEEGKRRFVIALGEENALSVIRALRYKAATKKEERLKDVFYFSFDSFSETELTSTKESLKKIFAYIIGEIIPNDTDKADNSDIISEVEKVRFKNQIDKARLIELAKKEIEEF